MNTEIERLQAEKQFIEARIAADKARLAELDRRIAEAKGFSKVYY